MNRAQGQGGDKGMGPKKRISAAIDSLRVLLGLKLRCEWVCARFNEYYTWDLSPSHFRAIASHLHACPGCMEEWQRTEKILTQIESTSAVARRMEDFSSERFMADLSARIAKYESEQAAKAKQQRRADLPRHYRGTRLVLTLPRLVTTFSLLISASALAYFGPAIWDRVSKTEKSRSARDGGREAVQGKSFFRLTGADAQSSRNAPLKPLANPAVPPQIVLDSAIANQIEQITTRSMVEMLMPRTEEQWMDWAWREYPHIMMVHEALTNKESGVNWNGVPTFIPEWAKSVWTDQEIGPKDWRALVCYSGEILKFDYPEADADSLVRPTLEAMQRAALIAGYEIPSGTLKNLQISAIQSVDRSARILEVPLPLLPVAQHDMANGSPGIFGQPRTLLLTYEQTFISGYTERVSDRRDLQLRVLAHLAASSTLIPQKPWAELGRKSRELMQLLGRAGETLCDPLSPQLSFRSLLIERNRLVSEM